MAAAAGLQQPSRRHPSQPQKALQMAMAQVDALPCIAKVTCYNGPSSVLKTGSAVSECLHCEHIITIACVRLHDGRLL